MKLARTFVTSVLMTVVTTVLLGLVYPVLVTVVAQELFPDRANGQLLTRGGQLIGSRLIGQTFSSPGYFRSRPSAAGAGYDPTASAGSNLGPTSKTLVETVQARVTEAQRENPGVPVPIDLVTASGSGLDPHISPAAAFFQAPRVARERGVSEPEMREEVARHIEGRQWGFLGEPRVNVLILNLAIDAKWPRDGNGPR